MQSEGHATLPRRKSMQSEGHAMLPQIKSMQSEGHAMLPRRKLMQSEGHAMIPQIKSMQSEGHATLSQIKSMQSEGHAMLPQIKSMKSEGHAMLSRIILCRPCRTGIGQTRGLSASLPIRSTDRITYFAPALWFGIYYAVLVGRRADSKSPLGFCPYIRPIGRVGNPFKPNSHILQYRDVT